MQSRKMEWDGVGEVWREQDGQNDGESGWTECDGDMPTFVHTPKRADEGNAGGKELHT